MKMLQIKSDGTVKLIDNNDYQSINTAVGGYIEAVEIDDKNVMYCNEEGKLNSLPPNYIATTLFQNRYGKVDVICGDVVIIGVGAIQENGFNDGESHEPTDEIIKAVDAIVLTLQPNVTFKVF